MELFVTIVNNFAKSSLLDVAGVSGDIDSRHQSLGIVQICSLWLQETVNLKIVLIVFYKEEGSGRW